MKFMKTVLATCLAVTLVSTGVYGAASLVKPIADTDKTTTYSSIPESYVVTLGYVINGETTKPADATQCDDPSANAACMTTLQAAQDSVIIKYTTESPQEGSQVRIQMCYGPEDIKDRPWRKYSNTIASNKQCSFDVAYPEPATGEYTYQLPDTIPTSVYTMQVIEVDTDGSYVAYGNSTYFAVNQIDDTPAWLQAVTGILSTLGPISLVGFFLWEYKVKNKN